MRRKTIILPLLMIALLTIAANLNQARFNQYMSQNLPAAAGTTTQHTTPTINLLLGGFRGIVADWLWVRSMLLQEQARFVEIVQLAEWITALQPQFPDIWIVHAWNLAYNIPFLLPDYQERWRWVLHGYQILRDRAAPATRFDALVCAELSWILNHKIAGNYDEAADTYFSNWINLLAPLLEPDGRLPVDPQKRQIFIGSAGIPPKILEDFEARFGPHDWRHPLTHSAAWAFTGLTLHPDAKGATRAARSLSQAYTGLFLQGTLYFSEDRARLLLLPDFSRTHGLLQIIEINRMRTPHPLPLDSERMLLERLIKILLRHRQNALAESLFALLAERFPEDPGVQSGLSSFADIDTSVPIRQILMEKTHHE